MKYVHNHILKKNGGGMTCGWSRLPVSLILRGSFSVVRKMCNISNFEF
jgi:hypothetical protein